MQSQLPLMALLLVRERHEREIAHAAAARRAGRQSSSVRQAVGRRIIAIGARVAAEPSLEPARSR